MSLSLLIPVSLLSLSCGMVLVVAYRKTRRSRIDFQKDFVFEDAPESDRPDFSKLVGPLPLFVRDKSKGF